MFWKSESRSQKQIRRQSTLRSNLSAGLVALLGLGLVGGFLLTSGCAKSTSSNATTFTEIYNASFSTSCLNCHSGNTSGVTLDFSNADTAYNQLVNVAVEMPSSPSSSCRNLKRVTANSPSTSYLMAILFSSYRTSNFGGQSSCVPYALNHDNLVSDSEKSSIESWINAGASR